MYKHYVIGDVHGMYDTLLALLEKIPKDAKVIFVGDLIDRGKDSAKVIKLVRDSGYKVVLGNHEDTLIRFFNDFKAGMSIDELKHKWKLWIYSNGGIDTLNSYNFFSQEESSLKTLEDDILWLQNLPLYLKLDAKHKSNLPVVISHSNITNVWHLRDDKSRFKEFKDTTIRGRDLIYNKKSKIVNIIGHTPIEELKGNSNLINVDRGCCYSVEEFGTLAAYCIEDDKFLEIRAI